MSSVTPPKFWLIIPAAGIGSRMRADKPKQYLEVDQKTILEHTLSCFLGRPEFTQIYIGVSQDDDYFESYGLHRRKGVNTFIGGEERADTVLKGLASISQKAQAHDWVWVHDAARPCLSGQEIDLLIQALEHASSGLVLGVPVSDTLKRIVDSQHNNKATKQGIAKIQQTVDRTGLWRAMTPQIFRYAELKTALEYCHTHGVFVTDEASAIEKSGGDAYMVHGFEQNIKVTLPDDLIKVEEYLLKQRQQASFNPNNNEKQDDATLTNKDYIFPRIGTGFDVHAFCDGDFITLGGVKIPHSKGLLAHSDGDVLLHAIMDALLGALALGDIGAHFPDNDEKWKGANSRSLLKAVNALITDQGYRLGNLDSTIIAQAPKMAPFIQTMQANIASDLGVDLSCVGVKATTTERLGFTGRKEGIACQASVILVPMGSGDTL